MSFILNNSLFNNFIYSILFSLIILVLFILFYYIKNYTYWSKKKIPYLRPTIPYGNAKSLLKETENFGQFGATIYNKVVKISRTYGGFFIFGEPVLLLVDPELIKSVLIKDFNNFHDRGIYSDEDNDPLSAHLVNISGVKWKNLRGKMSPAFTSTKMKMMFQTLLACSDELDNILERFSSTKEPMDVRDVLSRLTIDNIGSCAFGINCNSLKNPYAEFHKYGKLVIKTTFSNAVKQMFGSKFPQIMRFFKICIVNKEVARFFLQALKETVDYREKNNIHRNDFLDLFIKLKNNESLGEEHEQEPTDSKVVSNDRPFTFNCLAAQAFVFYVAGFETSSTALTFCLFELAQNQHIQNKLRDDILRTLKKNNDKISYDALIEMEYLDKVVNETLRKYPTAPMLNRVCNKPYKIPGTDTVLDKGVSIWIPILGMHRDPEIYPEPEVFDPERFSEKEKAKRHPFTYLPFGEGPRICIGMRFGLLQMKVGLVQLLKNYKFTLDHKTTLPLLLSSRGVFLAPKDKVWLSVNRISE